MVGKGSQPCQHMELGVYFAAARLDAQNVDQLLVGLDETWLERKSAAEFDLGFPDAVFLPPEPASQQVRLGGDGMIIGYLG